MTRRTPRCSPLRPTFLGGSGLWTGKPFPTPGSQAMKVMVWERPSPERLPALSWVGYRQAMSLTADWADHSYSGWASPTCIK